jgi:DNA-binding LacI/PurR family transcriptional regulator
LITKSRIRREDVALRAGVSKTTVSYVLNDTPGVSVSQATRQRVRHAAADLGYEPDFPATCMKRGSTEIVGLLVPDQKKQLTPFYNHMISGILEAAGDSDYHFLHLSQERWDKVERCLARNYVDGVIVIQSGTDQESLSRLQKFGLPLVSLNQLHPFPFPQVTMDYERVMAEAVTHLLGRGAKHLLFVHGTWDNQPLQRYRKVYDRLAGEHMPATAFSTMGVDQYQLSTEQMSGLLAGAWDGIIMDGYELARDLCQYQEFAPPSPKCPMVVFSETPGAKPLSQEVLIYQSQPAASGHQCWQAMLQLLAGEVIEPQIIRVPYQRLNQPSTKPNQKDTR